MLSITRQQQWDLSEYEKKLFRNRREQLKLQVKDNHLTGISRIYENQVKAGQEICDCFDDKNVRFVMGIAQPQSGKTTTAVSFIDQFIDRHELPIENIFVITGLNSKSWKKQTKERFPSILENKIYHRSDLKTNFKVDFGCKKNTLVILDEIQIAAKKKQTMSITFDELSFTNTDDMYKNNTRIVELTATPDGVLKDRQNWSDEIAKIVMCPPGVGYKGVFDFLDEGRVAECLDLCGYHKDEKKDTQDQAKENIAKLGNFINETYGFNNPKYHVIRTPTGKAGQVMMSNFENMYNNNAEYETYNGMSEENKINIFDIQPEKHTFVFIMELMRCADTVNKEYIGVWYERWVKKFNDSAVIQSAGRLNGYGDTGETYIFTNVESLELYRLHYESKFTRTDLPWNCNTKNGTYASEDSESESGSDNGENEYGYKVFENDQRYCDLEIFTRSHLGGWVPRTNVGKNINELRNHTSSDLIARHWGLSNKNPKRLALGTDGKWVVWWLTKFYPGVYNI